MRRIKCKKTTSKPNVHIGVTRQDIADTFKCQKANNNLQTQQQIYRIFRRFHT